jgi:hypothetical protein
MVTSGSQSPSTRLLLAAAAWAVGLAGCQLAFGEYRVGHAAAGSAGAAHVGGGASGSSGGAQSTGGSGASDCSGTPSFRCQPDASLQACTDGVWVTIDTCTRPALCQPTLGVCDVCADGERTCTGSELGVCTADHTAFAPVATCVDPLYCDPTADHCVACSVGQARCNGAYLAVCNADRTAWDLRAQSCALGCQVVDGITDYCNDCTADSPSACTTPTTLRSCVSGRWKATDCSLGCVDATATTPAACLN